MALVDIRVACVEGHNPHRIYSEHFEKSIIYRRQREINFSITTHVKFLRKSINGDSEGT